MSHNVSVETSLRPDQSAILSEKKEKRDTHLNAWLFMAMLTKVKEALLDTQVVQAKLADKFVGVSNKINDALMAEMKLIVAEHEKMNEKMHKANQQAQIASTFIFVALAFAIAGPALYGGFLAAKSAAAGIGAKAAAAGSSAAGKIAGVIMNPGTYGAIAGVVGGAFEISSNVYRIEAAKYRQKIAHHEAEVGIDRGVAESLETTREFVLTNLSDTASAKEQVHALNAELINSTGQAMYNSAR